LNHKSYEPGGQRQEPGGQAQRAPRRDSSAEEIWIELEWWEKSKKKSIGKWEASHSKWWFNET